MDDTRAVMLNALEAGYFGEAVPPGVVAAVQSGDANYALDELQFDSLAWMEFCISVELQTGRELSPLTIEDMTLLSELEAWLAEGPKP